MTELWAIAAAGLLLATFGVNEVSHGAVSETVGLGHQHMTDVGGYHCTAHDHPDQADEHMAHMHGDAGNATAHHHGGPHNHQSCYEDGSRMHEQHGQDGPHGDGDHHSDHRGE